MTLERPMFPPLADASATVPGQICPRSSRVATPIGGASPCVPIDLRGLLGALACIVPASAPLAVAIKPGASPALASTDPDPIFAAIEAHRSACKRYIQRYDLAEAVRKSLCGQSGWREEPRCVAAEWAQGAMLGEVV